LAGVLRGLLGSTEARERMGAAAARHAASRSFAGAARALYDAVVSSSR
jgi:hypothetical protein